MERFCNKCGSLVSGDGVFCPNCGEKLESAVDLGKPAAQVEDMMPTVPSTPVSTNNFGTTNTTYGTTNTTNTTTTSNMGGYQGQMPSYNQTVVVQPAVQNNSEMTVGQWVLTIFLSGLGIIGLILLFVWAFGSDTPTSKKNYARAMLIWQAIAVGLVIIFYIGLFACVGAAGVGLSEIFDEMGYYAAINNLFIR